MNNPIGKQMLHFDINKTFVFNHVLSNANYVFSMISMYEVDFLRAFQNCTSKFLPKLGQKECEN